MNVGEINARGIKVHTSSRLWRHRVGRALDRADGRGRRDVAAHGPRGPHRHWTPQEGVAVAAADAGVIGLAASREVARIGAGMGMDVIG